MLSRLSFFVLVAGAGIVCRYTADADPASEVVVGSYGVKLCGREFIRAVIYTCGGSRWKRSLGEEFEPFQVSSMHIDADKGDNQNTWQRGLVTDARRSPVQVSLSAPPHSLADLLSLLGAAGGEPAGSREEQQREWLRHESQARSPSAADSASTAVKRKRDFNLGVAGMCCSQGCTKSDIGYLC